MNSSHAHALAHRLASFSLLLLALLSCARLPTESDNLPPVIVSLNRSETIVNAGSEILFTAITRDPDGDSTSTRWEINRGQFLSVGTDSALWKSPDSTSYVRLIFTVEDALNQVESDTSFFWVENRAPVFTQLGQESLNVLNGNTISLWAEAIDPDSQQVELQWQTPFGSLQQSSGDSVRWTAPDSTVRAWIAVIAQDQYGIETTDTLFAQVYSEIGCVWVIDQGNAEVVKLSAAGDELLRIGGLGDPMDLDIDPENRRLWVCQGTPPVLKAFDLQGNELFSREDLFSHPVRLRSWYRNGSVFVLDDDSAQVVEVAFSGNSVRRRLEGFGDPLSFDLHQRTGKIWVCDPGAYSVWQIDPAFEGNVSGADTLSAVSRHGGFHYPVDVSVEDSTGASWVVDKELGLLVRYGESGEDSLIVPGFSNPVAIDAAWSEGLVWVLDRALVGRAVRLFYSQLQAEADDISFPKALAYNRLDDHCWVLDSERNRLLKLNPDGAVVGSWTDFYFPSRLVINSGY